jgi:hypothetical protein
MKALMISLLFLCGCIPDSQPKTITVYKVPEMLKCELNVDCIECIISTNDMGDRSKLKCKGNYIYTRGAGMVGGQYFQLISGELPK